MTTTKSQQGRPKRTAGRKKNAAAVMPYSSGGDDPADRAEWYYEPWKARPLALALLRETETFDDGTELKSIATAASLEFRNYLKRRCEAELLFLGRVLGYTRILDRVHGPVADMAVDKQAAVPIIKKQHETDDPLARPIDGVVRQFLHLDPRGVYKTTLSITDTIQWIICLPEIRVCKLTATKPLANAITGEIADHFVMGDTPTLFQELYPEFAIPKREKRVGEFTAPNRTRNWREATVMAFSIETSISGWHFDILDCDDPVDNLNSSTQQGLEKVKKNYGINRKTLMPWGFINFKGTRYNPFDLWGDIIEKANPRKIKILIRGALRMQPGKRLEIGAAFPPLEEVELLFPELLSYEYLRDEFEDDPGSFMSQYMNEAYGSNEITFRREELVAATIPAQEVPISGEMFCACRLSYRGKQFMRYAAAAIGMMDGGRMYVVDAMRGAFTPSVLAHRIVQMARLHGATSLVIEETPGARFFEATIHNYAATMGTAINVRWVEFQEDDGARDLRLKSMEPLLISRRLLFSEGIRGTGLKDIYRQFSNYGMVDENELPDVISRMTEALPLSIIANDETGDMSLNWELTKSRQMHDEIHGLRQYAPVEPQVEEPEQLEPNGYGLDEIMPGING